MFAHAFLIFRGRGRVGRRLQRNCNNMPLFTQVTNGSYLILAGAWSWAPSQPTVSTYVPETGAAAPTPNATSL